MKFPKVKVQDKPAFEHQLMLWGLMRDCIGNGSWYELAAILGADKYTHGPKRIRKKRLRRYMTKLVIQDIFKAGQCERLEGTVGY